MIEEKWTLEEIREAYGEILRAYNEIFPLHPPGRKGHKETFQYLGVHGNDGRNSKKRGDVDGDSEDIL
jgi:hypothetical protein